MCLLCFKPCTIWSCRFNHQFKTCADLYSTCQKIQTSFPVSSVWFSPSLLFSPALTAVLYDLSRQIPQLKKDIQDGLLKMLSLVLMHKPLRHPGMPKGLAYQLASPSLTNIPEASDVGSITLALRTLGSFEFEGTGYFRWHFRLKCHFIFSLFINYEIIFCEDLLLIMYFHE